LLSILPAATSTAERQERSRPATPGVCQGAGMYYGLFPSQGEGCHPGWDGNRCRVERQPVPGLEPGNILPCRPRYCPPAFGNKPEMGNSEVESQQSMADDQLGDAAADQTADGSVGSVLSPWPRFCNPIQDEEGGQQCPPSPENDQGSDISGGSSEQDGESQTSVNEGDTQPTVGSVDAGENQPSAEPGQDSGDQSSSEGNRCKPVEGDGSGSPVPSPNPSPEPSPNPSPVPFLQQFGIGHEGDTNLIDWYTWIPAGAGAPAQGMTHLLFDAHGHPHVNLSLGLGNSGLVWHVSGGCRTKAMGPGDTSAEYGCTYEKEVLAGVSASQMAYPLKLQNYRGSLLHPYQGLEGYWTHYQFLVSWSSDSNKGEVGMWMDGQNLVPLFHVATLYKSVHDGVNPDGTVDPIALHLGLYRPREQTSTDVVYHSNFKVWKVATSTN
jgi:hypothetical protein